MKPLLLALAWAVPASAVSPSPALAPAYEIVLVDSRWPDRPFLVEVARDNLAGVRSLEVYLGNGVVLDAQGNVQMGLAIGRVEPATPTATHAWNFRIDPGSVVFQDMATEVCDASFEYVERNLKAWTAEVGTYCPWDTARLVTTIRKVWAK